VRAGSRLGPGRRSCRLFEKYPKNVYFVTLNVKVNEGDCERCFKL